jgi:hypothetical protein
MIEFGNHFLVNQFFELLKIKNEPSSGQIIQWVWGANGYMQFIGMAVNIPAGAVIAVNRMCHFEVKDLCDNYHDIKEDKVIFN